MKTISMGREKINKIDLNKIVVAVNIGSDDIIVVDGKEIIEMYKETKKENEEIIEEGLYPALVWKIENYSRNSFEILVTDNNEIKEVQLN